MKSKGLEQADDLPVTSTTVTDKKNRTKEKQKITNIQ